MSLQCTGARGAPLLLVIQSFIAAALAGCASPDRAPLDGAGVALSVSERDRSPATLVALVEQAGLAPFACGAPLDPSAAIDHDAAAFWHASALAYAPEVRAARRELAAARERLASAGRPGEIDGFVEIEELDRPDEFGRFVGTVDLLGILGLGPAATARELADAQARAARARLEIAAWDARVAVDRARATLAAVRAEREWMLELERACEATLLRAALLDERGRVAAEGLAMAHLAVHGLQHRATELDALESEARVELARAAGLAIDAQELDAISARTLDELEQSVLPGALPDRAALFTGDPRLRAALVEYAVAEARLFDEAAARWPSLRVGPHLAWRLDELLVGIVAASAMPWPGALEGRVRAASEEREAAREAAEDLLLAEEARARAALERTQAQLAALDQHARPSDVQSARLLAAAQARFGVEPMALDAWAQALAMRAEALRVLFATRLAAVHAQLDFEQVSGPLARAAEVEP